MKMSTARRPDEFSGLTALFIVVEAAVLIAVLEVIRRRSQTN